MKKKRNDLHIVSMGQGQGVKAAQVINKAVKLGDWVQLQNCHLAVTFMQELLEILEEQESQDVHPWYRLWLTSMPSDKFPTSILSRSIKITC